MGKKNTRYFACDFETTVYDGQEKTEVWAAACVEFNTEDVKIFHSIRKQFDYFKTLRSNIICYYHNLKFDGAFWLSFLIHDLKMQQSYYQYGQGCYEVKWLDNKEMPSNSFKYVISDKGQFYSITIKIGRNIIEIRDSLKLLPFSVKRIGKSFKTKHQKLEMQYKGYRYSGCEITEEERQYIANDVLVIKEALEMMYADGHDKLTIGSCCLHEYKTMTGKEDWQSWFTDQTAIQLPNGKNADEFVRKSYKGGWCYVKKGKENKVFNQGLTADVNSLYPSVMHSKSGNAYPVGNPTYWQGTEIPQKALQNYYFIHIKTRFYLKKGKLPFIQIKDRYIYKGNECLESSDYYDPITKQYYAYYYDDNDNLHDTRVELTLTKTDYELFLEHYDVVDFEIIDGVYYTAVNFGIFDPYIDTYAKIKITSKGAKREQAKLFLNNLYGKLATSTDSSFKIAFEKENGTIGFLSCPANDKQPVYIPCGSAITSYARAFTIRHAQENYEHFIYADTDSLHMSCTPEQVKGLEFHDTEFLCWKLESIWDEAIFVRQKTYIERVIGESENNEIKPVEPYYNIKCAGMPQKCKDLLNMSLTNTAKPKEECSEDELEFLYDNNGMIKRSVKDFKVGFKVCGKLRPVRINGGIILQDSMYEMR